MPATYPRTTNWRFSPRRNLWDLEGKLARMNVVIAGGTICGNYPTMFEAEMAAAQANAAEELRVKQYDSEPEYFYSACNNHPPFVAAFHDYMVGARNRNPLQIGKFTIELPSFKSHGFLDFSHRDDVGTVVNSFSDFAGARDFVVESNNISVYHVQPEVNDLHRFFGRKTIERLFPQEIDVVPVAMGVQMLHGMGKKLDSWEPRLPVDYKMERLAFMGKQFHFADVADRIRKGDMRLYVPTEREEDGFLYRVTSTSPDDFHRKGGFIRDQGEYSSGFEQVYEYDYRGRKSKLIGASKTTDIVQNMFFRPTELDGMGYTPERLEKAPLFVAKINPRASVCIDIENSADTFSRIPTPGKELRPFLQGEVALLGGVDEKDVPGHFQVHARWEGERIRVTLSDLKKNKNYLRSDWEA